MVLLNSDLKTEDPLWLDALVEFASANREYGIIGCTQYEYDSVGWTKLNSWTEYILWSGNREAMFMDDTDYGKPIENAYTISDLKNSKHLDCYFVQGAAMMVRGDVFQRIGMFDEIYFMFYDEVDFCRRARWLNIKTALIPDSRVKHVGAGHTSSSKKNRLKRNFYYSRNKYIYVFTDITFSVKRMARITTRLLYHDIKDALGEKEDISGIGQLFSVLGSLLRCVPRIMYKRNQDKGQIKKEMYLSNW
ncbi:hypothetical protein GCM10008014_30270 [Paenibacillus silvae]|uniref:Glycosyltransferase family 2 protein n=1 Tax=Paenibacillus silvae TaxID=1325358 RepID=A0ABQ1ZFE7_9BACL|nr:hypothetical protein GCM10008014_30270 [Paenibacillus silvae]